MKTYRLISILVIFTVLSCDYRKKPESEEHEEQKREGVVFLNEKQRKALNLHFGTFEMRNLTTVVKINGQLKVPPSSSADVTAVIGGNVKEIMVFHGDKVNKGQALAILEHPDYIVLQEEFAEMANRLEYLKQEYLRQKELFENKVGAGKDFQQVKAEYNTAKARYAGLQSRLQLLNIQPSQVLDGNISQSIIIIAPISGYVNEINIKLGTFVEAKDKLFSIIDITDIHADFLVYEKDVYQVKEGLKVHFTVSNRPGDELTASIFAIGKEFESSTRAVHIHAEINSNPGGLIPGMYITGHFHTDANYTRTLPEDAIVKDGIKSYIFVRDSELSPENESHGIDEQTSQIERKDDEVQKSEKNNENAINNELGFRMVEVITGQKDEGYIEIHLLDSMPENTQVVMNAAYYLLAEMKKEETGDDH